MGFAWIQSCASSRFAHSLLLAVFSIPYSGWRWRDWYQAVVPLPLSSVFPDRLEAAVGSGVCTAWPLGFPLFLPFAWQILWTATFSRSQTFICTWDSIITCTNPR